MNKQVLEELVKESKARHSALKSLFQPYSRIYSIICYAATAYALIKGGGEFTLPLVGLIVLACFLSLSPRFAPPIAGIPLLGRKILALLTDFLLLSIVSFLALFLLQSKDYLEYLTMLVVWVAFMYFVVSDCFLNGTLGKRVWGLMLADTKKSEGNFYKSFIRPLVRAFLRVFFTLLFPIICSGFLRDALMGDGSSRLRFFLGEWSAEFALCLVPISILFLGGNQSIVDKILGMSVQQKSQHVDSNPPKPRLSTWVTLVSSTIIFAFLLAALAYAGVGKMVASGGLPKEPPAKGFQQAETITDPKTIEPLWVYLPMNLRESGSVVRKIELFAASPNPFTFRSEDSHIMTPLNPAQYLNDVKQVRFVRVTVAPYMSTVTRMIIVLNFLALGGRSTTTIRPSFALLQIGSEQKYGLFSIGVQENILICWMGSNTNPVDFPMEAHPGFGVGPLFSFGEIYNLLLGNTWIIHQCCA
jgi:hypothetical protein